MQSIYIKGKRKTSLNEAVNSFGMVMQSLTMQELKLQENLWKKVVPKVVSLKLYKST